MANDLENKASQECGCCSDVIRDRWGWFLALGVALIVLGAIAIALPGLTSLGVTIMLGWLLLIGAIVQAVHAFTVPRWSGFTIGIITAVLYGIVGVLLLSNPLAGMLTLTIVLAAYFAIEGICKIVLSIQMKKLSKSWGWVLFSGLVSLALAAIIWAALPGDAFWVLGLLVGINFIFSGWATVMLALAVNRGSGMAASTQ